MASLTDPGPDFDGWRSPLVALARSVTRNHADAEDVVQEVWLRYDANRTLVRSGPAWLNRVTVRASIDLTRRRARRREVGLVDSAGHLAAESGDPGEATILLERLRSGVQLVLTRLTPPERVTLVGRVYCGLAYAQLAHRLQRSEPAVRQLHHRAVERVRTGAAKFDASRAQVDAVVARLRLVPETGHFEPLLEALAPSPEVVTRGPRRP